MELKNRTERCGCGNIVVGSFNPNTYRKYLTTVAKKGGMKAVLTVAGSVIPGFGNIAGFVAGTVIDVVYGDDINKLVDKVADEFESHKVYVFTCPNCGKSWTKRYTVSTTYATNPLGDAIDHGLAKFSKFVKKLK